jgi:hypothetical protein
MISGLAIRINDQRVGKPNHLNVPIYYKFPLKIKSINNGETTFQERNPYFIKWPLTFFFSNTQYTPDFLDPYSNTFYEIVGTRQRYYQGQNRMLRARKWFGVKIVLCQPDGETLIPRIKHGGYSYPINKVKTFAGHPISEYAQEDNGKSTYTKKES